MGDKNNIVGVKIRERRMKLNMTQDELAEKMGYKSRTSIAKIENGRPCTQKVIVKLANALDTTPPYLMGWEDNLTDHNADLTVELLTRSDVLGVVEIMLHHNREFTAQMLQYAHFLESQEK